MKHFSNYAALALCCAALALAACRREEPSYVPMKLGGAVQHTVEK